MLAYSCSRVKAGETQKKNDDETYNYLDRMILWIWVIAYFLIFFFYRFTLFTVVDKKIWNRNSFDSIALKEKW